MTQEEVERLVTACRELSENLRAADFDTTLVPCNVGCVRTLIQAVTGLIEREQGRME